MSCCNNFCLLIIQGQSNNSESSSTISIGNQISLHVDIPSTKNEQFQCEDDCLPKVLHPFINCLNI